jgi:hypothetical protein
MLSNKQRIAIFAVLGAAAALSLAGCAQAGPVASTNADLASLTVSSGTLSPAFDAATTDYAVSVDNSVATITVSGVAADSGATVGGDSGVEKDLAVGSTTIAVSVTAADGTSVKSYKVVATRSAPGDYTITFDKNASDATGTMAAQTITKGSVANLAANAYSRPWYSFAGWSTTSSGSVAYADKASYTIGDANLILYAQWKAHDWEALGSGLNGVAYRLAFDSSGNLYAVMNGLIEKWNGSTWSFILDEVIEGEVHSLACDAFGNLYAGGSFSSIVGVSGTSNIAKWDGASWTALGTGIDGTVRALACDASGNLYAGGQFTAAGGVTATNFAKWDGSSWSALGANPDGLEARLLVCDASNNLYAGCENIVAKWNGSSWSAFGDGLNQTVYALTIDSSGKPYVGGGFTKAGDTAANYVAKWSGSSWAALGAGADNPVTALVMDDSGNLYAGGDFTAVGGTTAKYVAKWHGSTWSALGTGMNNSVCALAFDASGNLYAGGAFTTAGGVSANYIAKLAK